MRPCSSYCLIKHYHGSKSLCWVSLAFIMDWRILQSFDSLMKHPCISANETLCAFLCKFLQRKWEYCYMKEEAWTLCCYKRSLSDLFQPCLYRPNSKDMQSRQDNAYCQAVVYSNTLLVKMLHNNAGIFRINLMGFGTQNWSNIFSSCIANKLKYGYCR